MDFYCKDIVLDHLEGRKLLSKQTAVLSGHRDEMHLLYSMETLFKILPHLENI